VAVAHLSKLRAGNIFSAHVKDATFGGPAAATYSCWALLQSCYGTRLFGIAFADLFLYHEDHLLQALDGDAVYEVPIFFYNLSQLLSILGIIGYADDNWSNGTQSFVYGFGSPQERSIGLGFTYLATHETGYRDWASHGHVTSP
jgi:hypothetical protein